jgi:small-conductance mechanosensitive channel
MLDQFMFNTEIPNDTAIRAVLTLLVVLIALVAGPLLARRSSRIPVVVEAVRNGKMSHGEIAERSSSGGKWIGRVTLASVWLAAVVGIAFIWLAGQVNVDRLLKDAGDLGARFGISLLVLAMTLVIARILQRSAAGSLARGRLNVNLVRLGGRVTYTLIVVVGVVIILDIWGTGLVLPVTLVGALTVALSLALQDILKNLVAGVYLLVERPFVIGDQISVSPYTGEVEDIHMRVTVLRTLEDERVLVPNALLFTSPVVNQSFYRRRRAALTVTILDGGPDAVDKAEEQILQSLVAVPKIIKQDPAPEVSLSGTTGGKVTLRAIFWLPTMPPPQQAGVISDAIEQMRIQLPEAEIAMQDTATA